MEVVASRAVSGKAREKAAMLRRRRNFILGLTSFLGSLVATVGIADERDGCSCKRSLGVSSLQGEMVEDMHWWGVSSK